MIDYLTANTQSAPFTLTLTAQPIQHLDDQSTVEPPAHGSWRPKTLFGSLWAAGGHEAPISPPAITPDPEPSPSTDKEDDDDDDTLKGRSSDNTRGSGPSSDNSPPLATKAAARLSSFFSTPAEEPLQPGPRRKVVGSPVALDRTEALANRFSSWTPSTRESWSGAEEGGVHVAELNGDDDDNDEANLAMAMEDLMVGLIDSFDFAPVRAD